jgi:hypothetical protein
LDSKKEKRKSKKSERSGDNPNLSQRDAEAENQKQQ